MTIIDTKRLRVKFDACEECIIEFAWVYPNGLDPAAWTREEQIRVLQHTDLRMYLGWAWENGVVPRWPMIGVNLHGANLSEADLYRADLTGADLTGADLSKAYMRGAALSEVKLTGAVLRGADLFGANLSGADLTGADLTATILHKADLTGATWDRNNPPAGWRVNMEGRLEKC